MKHKLTHRLLAAVCLFSLLLTLTPIACALPESTYNPFADIDPSAYYADAVVWAYENGITAGTTDTTFSPSSACTRGQVMTFLWRAMGRPEPAAQSNPFEDVKSSDYYYKPILWAYESGVTAGSTDTTFSPNDTCTNGHVVTFLWRANGRPAAGGTSYLADSFPRDYYTDAIAWADSSGLLADTGTDYSPSAQSPRANIVTYLYRNQSAGVSQPEEQPEQPAQSEEPEQSSSATLANGMDITDDNIRAIIYSLQSEYPEGRRWTNDNSYVCMPLYTIGYGCAAFALICSDAVFGSFPVSDTHSDFDRVKVGDMIRAYNDTHTVIVLEKKENSVIVAEGNYNSSIHWGREISRKELEEGNFYTECRYPV